ncbi:MAG: hypothetical protein ACXVSX_16465 [Solirubrobacteraceae bacterium]
MSPAVRRAAIAIAGVAVIVIAFVVLSGGSDSSSTPTTATGASAVPTVRVVDAKPQGGVLDVSFKKGGTVRFRVASDTADEIHVHGYDLHKDVVKGGTVTFSFPAKIEGRFVVELETHGAQIAQLDVTP